MTLYEIASFLFKNVLLVRRLILLLHHLVLLLSIPLTFPLFSHLLLHCYVSCRSPPSSIASSLPSNSVSFPSSSRSSYRPLSVHCSPSLDLYRALSLFLLHHPHFRLAIPLSLLSFSWLFFLFSFFLSFLLCCFFFSSSPSPVPSSTLPLFTFPDYFISSISFLLFSYPYSSCSYIIYFKTLCHSF